MRDVIRNVNLGLRFLLELCAIAALCYWGIEVGPGPLGKLLLAVAAPAAMIAAWGSFVAPRSKFKVSSGVRLAVEMAVFAAASAALWHAGQVGLAIALAGVYAVNRTALGLVDRPAG